MSDGSSNSTQDYLAFEISELSGHIHSSGYYFRHVCYSFAHLWIQLTLIKFMFNYRSEWNAYVSAEGSGLPTSPDLLPPSPSNPAWKQYFIGQK